MLLVEDLIKCYGCSFRMQKVFILIDLKVIGTVKSCFKEKFGIPRQPGLATEAKGIIELLPPFSREEAVRGLEKFSHIWVSFIFHQTMEQGWRPMVRPPRLGGNMKVGVFASRSMFRPNPIGLSVVKLDSIDFDGGVKINISGIDLLDGTPVIDIKPYLPYVDSIAGALGGFAPQPPNSKNEVLFSAIAVSALDSLQGKYDLELRLLITQVLQSNPAPAYINDMDKLDREKVREYGMKLLDFDLKWRFIGQGKIEVISLV